jgi:TIR domain
MSDPFSFDVILSYSSKDKGIVRPMAERLRGDGLRVWFDGPGAIEQGLERSRVLVLCMSANAFGAEWEQLEADTFRFRDPLNAERRFVPLRLDEAPIKRSLSQFLYLNWRAADREQEYARLLKACRPPAREARAERERVGEKALQLDQNRDDLGRDPAWRGACAGTAAVCPAGPVGGYARLGERGE